MVARASQKQAVDKMASTYDRLKWVWTLDTESAERFSKIQNCKEGISWQRNSGVWGFKFVYVGGLDKAMHLMQDNFLELGLKREDCAEMTWMT